MTGRRICRSASAVAVCFLLILLLVFEDEALRAAAWSMELATKRVIPALFPYMVISSVIVSQNLLEPLYPAALIRRLFGLPPCAAGAVLCGFLSGFPTGALCTCRLYEKNLITKEQASSLTAVSSNTSPAFLIGALGALWGDVRFGVFLMTAQLFLSCATGVVFARRNKAHLPDPAAESASAQKESIARAICKAVSDASLSCLAVAAYIVFFGVMAAMLSHMLPFAAPYISALLEFSSGTYVSSRIGGICGGALCGFSVGFCSLSVHMQIYNFVSRHGIPYAPVFLSKIVQGGVLAALSALYACAFPLRPSEAAAFVAAAPSFTAPVIISASLALVYALFNTRSISRR